MLNLDNLILQIQHSQKTLFILCGFPYAGKSYVASTVCAQTDIAFVSIDEIFHARGFDWNTDTLPNAEEWAQIFDESFERTKDLLAQGKNVLYDSTNQTVESRDQLRKVADSVGADARVVYVKTAVETVWKRWEDARENQHRSVVGRELVQATIDMFEEPAKAEQVLIIEN